MVTILVSCRRLDDPAPDDGRRAAILCARGRMVAIVPQNTSHRFEAPGRVSVMTATPQPTEHLTVEVEDPRMVG